MYERDVCMSHSGERLKALYRERTHLLKSVLALTRLQPELLKSEDGTDALLTNISERQKLIDQINSLKEELASLPPLGYDTECDDLDNEARSVLREIQSQDAVNERLATERMEHLREKLKKNKEGRTAIRGYDSRGTIDAVYFDKQK